MFGKLIKGLCRWVTLLLLLALAIPMPGYGQSARKSGKGAGKGLASLSAAELPESVAAAVGGKVKGFMVLTPELKEEEVRKAVQAGEPGQVFILPAGCSWTLTGTLEVPEEVTIIGFNPGSSKTPTFIKGFDGPLLHVHSWVTLQGLVLDGSRKQFKGDGILAGGGKSKGVRELILTRVEASNNAGNGYTMASPTDYSHYNFCTFDHNGGYGVEYGEVRSHHTDNFWQNCHYGWNDKGGIVFHAVEVESIWDNCEWFHNGGPAFEHFLVRKQVRSGEAIGELPSDGASVLQIRSCIFRQCAAPVWLHRVGASESIVFEDCRMKHNGDPAESAPTKNSGKSVEELFQLTPPVGGMVHMEGGRLCVEFRGGFAYDGGAYLFTAGPKAEEGCRILLSGSSITGFAGSIHNPRGYATILDRSLLKPEAVVNVKSGIALNPLTGKVEALGPCEGTKKP